MKKVYLILLSTVLFFKVNGQTDISECAIAYEKAIQLYIENTGSLELKNKLDSGKTIWENCLIGKKIPTIKTLNINGDSIKVDTGLNTLYVLQFWAEWCVPCMYEIPIINKLVNEYKNSNVVFLSLSPDKAISFKVKDKFLSELILGINSKEFSVLAYPTIFLVSSNLVIEKIYQGINPESTDDLYYRLCIDIEKRLN